MTKRIEITSGDYVLLSDIPNEQVFDLVKECFMNAGFRSISSWSGKYNWDVFHVYGVSCCFTTLGYPLLKRRLSLSDIFNSTNGGFDWERNTIIIRKATLFGDKFLHVVCGAEMVTLNKIIDPYIQPNTYKITKAFDIQDLQHMDIASVEGRATGKSTAHHLELIAKAVGNPEMWVYIKSDHMDTSRHNRWAFDEVKELCYKLGLDWMEFTLSGNSMRYMPYQTVKLVTKWERVK